MKQVIYNLLCFAERLDALCLLRVCAAGVFVSSGQLSAISFQGKRRS
jgi:hypothetical protein